MATFARLPLDVLARVQDYGRFDEVAFRRGRFVGRIAANDPRRSIIARILNYHTWLASFNTYPKDTFCADLKQLTGDTRKNYWGAHDHPDKIRKFNSEYDKNLYGTNVVTLVSYCTWVSVLNVNKNVSIPRCARLLMWYYDCWRQPNIAGLQMLSIMIMAMQAVKDIAFRFNPALNPGNLSLCQFEFGHDCQLVFSHFEGDKCVNLLIYGMRCMRVCTKKLLICAGPHPP